MGEVVEWRSDGVVGGLGGMGVMAESGTIRIAIKIKMKMSEGRGEGERLTAMKLSHRVRDMRHGPQKERNDMLASFGGGGVLLLLAIWGIVCVLGRGDTVRPYPIRWGDGGEPVGWTLSFMVAVFGVALLWRGVDRWRALRGRSDRANSGTNGCAPGTGGPASRSVKTGISELPPSAS